MSRDWFVSIATHHESISEFNFFFQIRICWDSQTVPLNHVTKPRTAYIFKVHHLEVRHSPMIDSSSQPNEHDHLCDQSLAFSLSSQPRRHRQNP